MGEYSRLLKRYEFFGEEDKKEILKIFPRKEGKLIVPSGGEIRIPNRKTLVFFTSCDNKELNHDIIKKFESSLYCRVISVSDIIASYGKYNYSVDIINEVFEDDVIGSLEDGYVTVIEGVYTNMLSRAILLKGFEHYYDSAVAITLNYSSETKGSFIYDIFSSINYFNEDRKSGLKRGVDINYVVPNYLLNSVKIVFDKEV